MIKRLEQYNDMIARLYPETKEQKIQTADITFQITDACNLKCSYCYQHNKGNHIMSIETAKKFIDLLLDNNQYTQQYLDSKNSTACIIDFIGGEPLLQINLIKEISEYFIQQTIIKNHPWQYNYRFSICSNGVLYFNEDFQNYLKEYGQQLSFSISIDGNKKLHDSCRVFPNGSGSYDLAMAGVKDYVNNKHGYMGSKMTLSPENIQYTSEAVINLINEGYEDINLNCVFEKGWNYDYAKILYNELKKLSEYIIENDLEDKLYISMFREEGYRPKLNTDDDNWCGGNGRMIAVDWKGDIYPCLRYMESSLGDKAPPIIIGNVDDGIMVKPEHIAAAKMVQSVNRLTQSSQECIDCPIAEGCSWCQAFNYEDSGGNINHRATYICPMHKATSLANAYFWNLYYHKREENKRFKIWLPKEEALKIIDEEEWELLKMLETTPSNLEEIINK